MMRYVGVLSIKLTKIVDDLTFISVMIFNSTLYYGM